MDRFVIQHQRHKIAVPDALLLSRADDCYLAIDDDAQIVAANVWGNHCYRECACGESVRVCAVAWQEVDSVIDRLRERGHGIAVAEEMEEPDPESGFARTAIVRIFKSATKADRRAFDAEPGGARSPSPALIRQMVDAMSMLDEDNQQRAIRMVNRLRELLDDPEAEGFDGDDEGARHLLRFIGAEEGGDDAR